MKGIVETQDVSIDHIADLCREREERERCSIGRRYEYNEAPCGITHCYEIMLAYRPHFNILDEFRGGLNGGRRAGELQHQPLALSKDSDSEELPFRTRAGSTLNEGNNLPFPWSFILLLTARKLGVVLLRMCGCWGEEEWVVGKVTFMGNATSFLEVNAFCCFLPSFQPFNCLALNR